MNLLRFIVIFILIFISTREAYSEARLKSWANDGFFNVYAEIEWNGKLYRTDHPSLGSKMLKKIWEELDENDRMTLMKKVYYLPNHRKAHFGEELSREMTKWYNDVTGWTKAWEEFEKRHAKKAFPELQAFFDNEDFLTKLNAKRINSECYQYIYDTDKYKELMKLITQSEALFRLGKDFYKKLSSLQVQKVSTAIKGISKGLIELITDEILTPLITGGASVVSELIAEGVELGITIGKEGIDSFKDKIGYDPSPETVIRELSSLIESYEGLLKRVKAKIEENENKTNELFKEIEKDCANKKNDIEKKEEEKKKKEMADPPKPVVVQITPLEKNAVKLKNPGKTEKEIEEIALCEKVKQYHNRLMQEYNDKQKEYEKEVRSLIESSNSIKTLEELKPCSLLVLSFDSPCLQMGYFTIKELRQYLKVLENRAETYSRNKVIIEPLITRVDSLTDKYRDILVPLVKEINGLRINYRKCLGFEPLPSDTVRRIFEPLYNTRAHWLDLVRQYNIEIENHNISIKVTNEGIKRRIDWIKKYSLHYDSYETNLKNSLSQLVDAINKLNKLYEDEIFVKRSSKWQPPQVDFEKVKKIREEIFKIQDQSRRDRELNRIVERLTNLQEEIGRQVRRLSIAQGFTDDNFDQLIAFLENFSQGAVNSVQGFERFKQDVAEVTIKKINHPFYDIVKEITGNDPMLWKMGGITAKDSKWMVSPSFFEIDFESVINSLKGENEFSLALKELLSKIETEEAKYMRLNSSEFAKTITELNNEANRILERATIAGEAKPGSLVAQTYYNVMLKIRSIDENYYYSRELERALQELQSYIVYFKNLLERNLIEEFENAINTFSTVIKHVDEKVRNHKEVAKLISELEKTVSKMKSKLESEKSKIYTSIIQDFYKQFKSAYESRNDSLVMSLIDDSWSSGDGTTLLDLQNNLRRIFKTFDEIRFNLQNLKIEHVGQNIFRISYDLIITSRIYKRNIKHEEKSSVVEEVIVDYNSKKAKINRTISGRFW